MDGHGMLFGPTVQSFRIIGITSSTIIPGLCSSDAWPCQSFLSVMSGLFYDWLVKIWFGFRAVSICLVSWILVLWFHFCLDSASLQRKWGVRQCSAILVLACTWVIRPTVLVILSSSSGVRRLSFPLISVRVKCLMTRRVTGLNLLLRCRWRAQRDLIVSTCSLIFLAVDLTPFPTIQGHVRSWLSEYYPFEVQDSKGRWTLLRLVLLMCIRLPLKLRATGLFQTWLVVQTWIILPLIMLIMIVF